ncbi:MAG: hypothetical protein M8357_02465 [Desulfobulbaceae bacterium]|nr:hypothetical protein [Desulfobulbaceae bacterium]
MRGSWALARMKGKDGQPTKNWLLIKHKDDEAVSESTYSIVEKQPFSIATGRSLEEIAAGKESTHPPSDAGRAPDPSQLANARKESQPAVLKPQLETLADEPPSGEEWVHEIKLDGYRVLAGIKDGRVTLLTRSGKD